MLVTGFLTGRDVSGPHSTHATS